MVSLTACMLAPSPLPETESLQAKLNQANEERSSSQDVSSLQQEENVSISGSNARLMIMKKLSRKSEVGCVCVCVRESVCVYVYKQGY